MKRIDQRRPGSAPNTRGILILRADQVSCYGCGLAIPPEQALFAKNPASPARARAELDHYDVPERLALCSSCLAWSLARVRQANHPSRPKCMTAKEFRALGLLQEVNRRLLHPIGLALEVVLEGDGSEYFGQVWDSREDPEGFAFADGTMRRDASDYLDAQIEKRRGPRGRLFGGIIQPIDPTAGGEDRE